MKGGASQDKPIDFSIEDFRIRVDFPFAGFDGKGKGDVLSGLVAFGVGIAADVDIDAAGIGRGVDVGDIRADDEGRGIAE